MKIGEEEQVASLTNSDTATLLEVLVTLNSCRSSMLAKGINQSAWASIPKVLCSRSE